MGEVNADVQMTAADVRHAREVLRLTQSELAAELGTIPDIVDGFETGRVRVPARIAKNLRWRVALEAQERSLEAAGLGPCPESVALIERFRAPGADLVALSKSFDAHTAGCPHCQARERFAQSLPPLPEPPTSGAARAMNAFAGFIGRLPAWARPAAWGAALIGTIVLLRAVLVLLATGPRWRLLGMAAAGIAAGAYMGAVGGAAYRLVHPRAQKLGRIAPYVTAVACTMAYMLAYMVPAALAGEQHARELGGWGAAGVIALIFGLVFGYVLRKWMPDDRIR